MSASKGQTAPVSKAAPAIPQELETELHSLENIVRLASFACEARRTLDSLDFVMQHDPAMRERVYQIVQAPAQWSCHDDITAHVLAHVADRMAKLTANGVGNE